MKIIVLVIIATASVASSAGAVSIVNGSFENSVDPGKSVMLTAGDATSITGWTVTAGNIDLAGTAFQPSDGFHTVDLSVIGPGQISQTLTGLNPGSAYRVSFDLSGSYDRVRTQANKASVGVTGNASQFYTYGLNNTVENMMYAPSSYTFLAQGTTATLAFNGLDAGNYGAVIDNVAIAPVLNGGNGTVPEPAAWALLLGGFALTGSALRRRSNVVAN